MIEINLIEQKGKFKAPVIIGVDLGKLPLKKIVIAYLITSFPLSYLEGYFEDEVAKGESEVSVLNKRYQTLRKEVKKNDNIKGQLLAFNEQIEKLKTRTTQVNEIIQAKTNPRYILEKIARSVPENVWFNRLDINVDNEITIEGGTDSYTSIGEFIVGLNDSPFFARSLQLGDSKTEEEDFSGKKYRIEKFSIKGKVEVFNPFTQGR